MFSRIKKVILDYKKIKYLAYHDALTKLLNRNWLYEYISKITNKYVYFIDINNLKLVNTMGHTYGDLHIKTIVEILLEKVSNDDILIRYAGDEFLIFSNKDNLINTNKFYSVGCHNIDDDINEAIRYANAKMIDSKYRFKLNNKENSYH